MNPSLADRMVVLNNPDGIDIAAIKNGNNLPDRSMNGVFE
jgi:hypothetical protein